MELRGAQAILTHVEPGARALEVTALIGGVSAVTESIAFARPDGTSGRVVVRRLGAHAREHDPGALAREHRVLALARAHGVPTPTPRWLDEAGVAVGEPCLVVEHVDGEATFAPADVPDYAAQAASALAAVHRIGAEDARAFLTRGDVPPVPEVEDATPDLRAARELVRGWDGWERGAVTLLHGDFWPGNLLWRDGRLMAVIDWEDALIGDPHRDVAIARLDVLWLFGADALHAFTEAYARAAPLDPERLAYWDLRAALRPGPLLPVWAPVYAAKGRPDVTEHTMRDGQHWLVRDARTRLGTS